MRSITVHLKNVSFFCVLIFLDKTDCCPIGAELDVYNGLCYWIAVSGTAQECHSRCVAEGGSIAEIPNEEAQLFLIEKFLGRFYSSSDSIWIGVNDIETEDSFKDWSGNTQNYFYWRHQQPNDDTEVTDQDCVAMFGGSENFEWQDQECYESRDCICSSSTAHSSKFVKVLEDSSLTGCNQEIMSARSSMECIIFCAYTMHCSSVNYNEDEKFCEHNLCNSNGTLITRLGYTYFEQVSM